MEKHNSRSSNTPNSQENELDSLIANTSEVDPSLAQELLAPHQANNSHLHSHGQQQQAPYSGVETRSGHSSPGAASASSEHPQSKTAKLESHSVIGQQQQMQNQHLQQQQRSMQNHQEANPMYAVSNLQSVSGPQAMMMQQRYAYPGQNQQHVVDMYNQQQQHMQQNLPQHMNLNVQHQQNLQNQLLGRLHSQQQLQQQLAASSRLPQNSTSPVNKDQLQMQQHQQLQLHQNQQQQQQPPRPDQVGEHQATISDIYKILNMLVQRNPQKDIKMMIQMLVAQKISVEDFTNNLSSFSSPQESEQFIMYMKKNISLLQAHVMQQQSESLNARSAQVHNQSSSSLHQAPNKPTMNQAPQTFSPQSNFSLSGGSAHDQRQSILQKVSSTNLPTMSPFIPVAPNKIKTLSSVADTPNINLDNLQHIILIIISKYDEIISLSSEVPQIIAHSIHLKLSQFVWKLYQTTYHRITTKKKPQLPESSNFKIKEINNPKAQLSAHNQLTEFRHKSVDMHNMLAMVKHIKNKKTQQDIIAAQQQNTNNSRAVTVQAAIEAEQQRDANRTAMAALGDFMKKKRIDPTPQDADPTAKKPEIQKVVYKSTCSDLIYVLENNKHSKRSLALYQKHLDKGV